MQAQWTPQGPTQPAPMQPPPTVWGTPLGPGERVIYFHRRDGTVEKVVLIIVGIILLIGIVGLVFLIIGIMAKPEAWVVTNHRIMHIKRGQPAEFVVATEVKQVYKKLGGTIVKWLNLVDAQGRKVDLQCTCNPSGYAAMIERYLQNPALLEQAPPVPYEA